MRMSIDPWFLLGFLALHPTLADAQVVASSGETCLLRPIRDRCEATWVFEIAGYVPLAVSARHFGPPNAPREEFQAFGPHVSWDLGYVRRIDGRSSLGVVGMAGFGGPAERLAIKSQYGLDLSGPWSLDVSGGWLYAAVDGFTQTDGRGVTADVRVSRGDWLSAGLRYDRVTTEAIDEVVPGSHLFPVAEALYGGVTLRQQAALWGTAGVVAALGGYVVLYWLFGPEE